MPSITYKKSTDGKSLIITVPLAAKPEPSGTGKTLNCGTTSGFDWETGVKHLNEEIGVSLNVCIKNKAYKK